MLNDGDTEVQVGPGGTAWRTSTWRWQQRPWRVRAGRMCGERLLRPRRPLLRAVGRSAGDPSRGVVLAGVFAIWWGRDWAGSWEHGPWQSGPRP